MSLNAPPDQLVCMEVEAAAGAGAGAAAGAASAAAAATSAASVAAAADAQGQLGQGGTMSLDVYSMEPDPVRGVLRGRGIRQQKKRW